MSMSIPKIISALDSPSLISIEDCWTHLRVTPEDDSPPSHPDDGLILANLAAAREWVENYSGLSLSRRTLEIALDSFPVAEIVLPAPPTISILSVKYIDGDDVEQTIDNTSYVLDDYQRPSWLIPAFGFTWPTPKAVVNAVKIQYLAGYSLRTAAQTNPLPSSLRSAVLLVLGALYEDRENQAVGAEVEIPLGARSLCDSFRVRKGMA